MIVWWDFKFFYFLFVIFFIVFVVNKFRGCGYYVNIICEFFWIGYIKILYIYSSNSYDEW